MVGYLHLHIACLAAMPTTQRTDDHTHTITRTHERFDLYLEIYYYYLRGVHSCLKSRIQCIEYLRTKVRIKNGRVSWVKT